LHFAESLDLPDPEQLLARPGLVRAVARSEELIATLAAVTSAVTADCTLDRWTAAWEVLANACAGGAPDVAAVAASSLLDLRQKGWPAPSSARAFIPVLRQAALL
jgi:hypothetical protein